MLVDVEEPSEGGTGFGEGGGDTGCLVGVRLVGLGEAVKVGVGGGLNGKVVES